MDTVANVLILLLAVVLSDFLARLLSRLLPFQVPRPVLQIALGALIGGLSDRVVRLDPEVFFLLFLPPLLFLDGWRIPSDELFKDKGVVTQLALGLVVFTVLGMGTFIHWLIPAMPLAVAFALAAMLSPTDPIAVAAVARRAPISRRIMHILEGESLLNDATGLVCFSVAVTALLTGRFSLGGALVDFVWLAGSGITLGVALTLALARLKSLVSKHLGEDSSSQILISLLTPFGCYLLAEMVHGSGILAAVAAGLTMSFVESSGQAPALTRVRRATVWDAIQFSANGMIFVLLGEQLHEIAASAAASVALTGHSHPAWLGVLVLAISLGLAVLRFAWVWLSLRWMLFHARGWTRQPDSAQAEQPLPTPVPGRPGWRLVSVMSLAGVRGAVTLAGVLSLPLMLPGGTPFPARDLAILLAMGVILVSLLAASIGLPWLLQGLDMPPDPRRAAEEAAARLSAAHAAIAAIEHQQRERPEPDADPEADLALAAAARVIAGYRARIDSRTGSRAAVALAERGQAIERALRLVGLQAERDDVFRDLRARQVGSETARKLIRELDLMEARHAEEGTSVSAADTPAAMADAPVAADASPGELPGREGPRQP